MRLVWPEPRWTLPLVPGGLIAAGGLLGAILVFYPRPIVTGFTPTAVALAVLLDFVVAALVVTWFDTRPRDPAKLAARKAGIVAGLIGGGLWLVEIAFNNLSRASAATRLVVDDSVWALVALVIVVVAARQKNFRRAVTAGLWSGTVSGLIACLAGLALATLFMPALLSDPLNITEYAARVPGGVPRMADYFAYETMTGALGHLLVLGVAMGLVLGLIGGGVPAVTTDRRWSRR